MVMAEEGNSWIYKNKDHGMCSAILIYHAAHSLLEGMMSAAASLGLSLLWETDVGISHVDKYTYSAEEHIKVYVEFLRLCYRVLTHYIRRLVHFLPQAC